VLWLVAVALGLGAAAARGLNAPQPVWIGAVCVAVVLIVMAVVANLRSVPASPVTEASPRDLALSLAAELVEAADLVGVAVQRGQWWLPSEAAPRAVWNARERELRAFGERFHKPVRDAYRKLAQNNRRAAQGEAAEYRAIGGELTEPGRELSDADRAALEATRGLISHALERLGELESMTRHSGTTWGRGRAVRGGAGCGADLVGEQLDRDAVGESRLSTACQPT
jgi:hypothetical protein